MRPISLLCVVGLTCILGCVGSIASEAMQAGTERPASEANRGGGGLFGILRFRSTGGNGMSRAADRQVLFTRDWLDAQPSATGDADWECLAEAIYFEARGESVRGQFAVAEVISNRVASEGFPDSVCEVVRQGTGHLFQCQFTYYCDGLSEKINEPVAYERAGKIARLILDGKAPNLTVGATHFHTTDVKPSWSRIFKRTTTIGRHHFRRVPTDLGRAAFGLVAEDSQ